MRNKSGKTIGIAILSWMAVANLSHGQIILGQLDTFQAGTVANWSQGPLSPNPPVNISTGGPAGVGDAYLRVTSNGMGGPGSKMITFNDTQWTGNYVSAGVTRITADMANFGTTPLHMRIAFRGGPGFTQFGSTFSTLLLPNSQWQQVTFDLTPTQLTNIAGMDSLNTTLSSISELRILSAQFGPSINGDTLAGILGVDNILATTTVPEPSSLVLGSLALAWSCRRLRSRQGRKGAGASPFGTPPCIRCAERDCCRPLSSAFRLTDHVN